MDKQLLARAFNEWMRRYTEEPERFEAEFATVKRFLAEQSGDAEPSYGLSAAEYLVDICAELSA